MTMIVVLSRLQNPVYFHVAFLQQPKLQENVIFVFSENAGTVILLVLQKNSGFNIYIKCYCRVPAFLCFYHYILSDITSDL